MHHLSNLKYLNPLKLIKSKPPLNTKKSLIQRVVVFSYDGFANYDWAPASQLPNLSKLIKKGSYSTQVQSVNPTLTYAAHTAMVTGLHPKNNHIGHNNPVQPFVPAHHQKWHWYANYIHGPKLYEELEKRGKKTAALLWPVTAKAKISYNLPEVRALPKENQVLKILRTGSPLYCLDLERRFGHIRSGIEQPYLDEFSAQAAAYSIAKYNPHLLLLHQIELDEIKHLYGNQSSQALRAIKNTDRRLGLIWQAIVDMGQEEETALVVIGDHSHLNSHTKIYLNRLLRLMGLINGESKRPDWRAWFQSSGGGAYLYLKQEEEYLLPLILEVLQNFKKRHTNSINRILNRKEMAKLNMISGPALFVEATPGFVFDDDWQKISDVESFFASAIGSDHGYLNDLPDYRSNVLFVNPAFKGNYQFGDMELTDLAPTLAYLLDLQWPKTQGRVLNEILK